MLTFCHIPECQCLLEGSFTHISCLISDANAQGIPSWLTDSSCQQGFHSWVTQDDVNQRKSSWQTTTLRALHRLQTEVYKDLQSLYKGGHFTCPGDLDWGVGFRFDTHLVAYRAAFKVRRWWIPSWSSLFLVLGFQYLQERSLYTCLSPNFYSFHSGNTSRLTDFGCRLFRVYICP